MEKKARTRAVWLVVAVAAIIALAAGVAYAAGQISGSGSGGSAALAKAQSSPQAVGDLVYTSSSGYLTLQRPSTRSGTLAKFNLPQGQYLVIFGANFDYAGDATVFCNLFSDASPQGSVAQNESRFDVKSTGTGYGHQTFVWRAGGPYAWYTRCWIAQGNATVRASEAYMFALRLGTVTRS